jgi:hypothetical protein
VTGTDDLERQYRRWLRWYPKSFRREYEEEILGVLMAGARAGQRRPGLLDCLNLITNALRMRLRPTQPRSERWARKPVRLMYIGALVELAAVVTILATTGDVGANLVGRNPGYPDAQWQAVVADEVDRLALAAGIAVACWLGLAWAIGRGHRWARIAFAIFFGVNVMSLLNGLADGSAIYAGADVAIGTILCLVQLVAVVLVFPTEFGKIARLWSAASRFASHRTG